MEDRVVLVRLAAEDLRGVHGGVLVQFVLCGGCVGVSVEDDEGLAVMHRQAVLTGPVGSVSSVEGR